MIDIYKKVTDQIIEKLQQGTIPWVKTWTNGAPVNLISKAEYRGINQILLGLSDYNSPYWATFKQIKDIGGSIKTGEKSNLVIFWKPIVHVKEDENSPEVDYYYMLRYYNVFNLEQVTLPNEVESKFINNATVNEIHFESEEIIKQYPNPPMIKHNNNIPAPCYIPSLDVVQIHDISKYHTSADYYSALFHELGHSTGATTRLNRPGVVNNIHFGTKNYSKEELVAEISSAMLCNYTGIQKNVDNHASYIHSWLKVLKNDKKMIIQAAAQAQKAVDFILNKNTQTEEV